MLSAKVRPGTSGIALLYGMPSSAIFPFLTSLAASIRFCAVIYCEAPISSLAPNSLGHHGSSTGLLPAKALTLAGAANRQDFSFAVHGWVLEA